MFKNKLNLIIIFSTLVFGGLFYTTNDALALNAAASANGGTATASSTNSAGYDPSFAINGNVDGAVWTVNGGWNDGTILTYPDWLEVTFNGSQTINQINVYSLQDNYTSPSPPTDSMTFTLYGLVNFDVQYWNGSAWATVPGGSITGNNLVIRKVNFANITTTKIRVLIHATAGNGNWSRIVEVEALTASPTPSVDIKANGSDGPINIDYNTAATISWTSANTSACNVQPTDVDGNSGSFSTGNLTANQTYTVTCFGAIPQVSDSVTVNVNALPAPSCTNATPDNDWTTATSGTRQAFANGVANATDVYFPTWSGTTSGEQDDLIWYHLGNGATNQGGGIWRADINLALHPGLGTISSHVYTYSAAHGQVWCDSANFTRLNVGTINVNLVGLPQATTWTITCTLANPACPNINQTTTSTNQSYPNKPYSNWTITPANITGYDWQVTGCAINTPCSQTFP